MINNNKIPAKIISLYDMMHTFKNRILTAHKHIPLDGYISENISFSFLILE